MIDVLLDANALLYILKTEKYGKLNKNCNILDLTFYEYGNAILNLLTKRTGRGSLSREETKLLLLAFEKISEQVTTLNLEDKLMPQILELAIKENLTFYDASYLYCCIVFGYYLITEDRRLASAAKNNSINVMDTEKWISSI